MLFESGGDSAEEGDFVARGDAAVAEGFENADAFGGGVGRGIGEKLAV